MIQLKRGKIWFNLKEEKHLKKHRLSSRLLKFQLVSCKWEASQPYSENNQVPFHLKYHHPDADQPTLPGDHVNALLEELGHLVLRLHDLQRRLPLPLVEPAKFFLAQLLGAANKNETLSAQNCRSPPWSKSNVKGEENLQHCSC